MKYKNVLALVLVAGLLVIAPAQISADERQEPVVEQQEVVQDEAPVAADVVDVPTEDVEIETPVVEDPQTEDPQIEEPDADPDKEETDPVQTEQVDADADVPAEEPAVEDSQPEKPAEDESQEEAEPVKEGTGAREIIVPERIEDYHFYQVDKVLGFAKSDLSILEAADEDARAVGSLEENGVMYLLKAEGDWLFVESGQVRGFVKAEDIYQDEKIEPILETYYGDDAQEADFDWTPYEAKLLVPTEENAAFSYILATTTQVVIDKVYATAAVDQLNIREGKGTGYPIVGKLSSSAMMYIIADADEDWVYVESGQSRGFVNRAYINTNTGITEDTEGGYALADTLIDPKDNDAYDYTMTSVVEGSPYGELGKSIVEYAANYIGNPYVWGGTSLINGADCSGFVQSIYAQYGIYLPRTAAQQSQVGVAIALSDAQPGDLVFYWNEAGFVYHVAIYAGNGETVEAANSQAGIIRGKVFLSDLAWCVRILPNM